MRKVQKGECVNEKETDNPVYDGFIFICMCGI